MNKKTIKAILIKNHRKWKLKMMIKTLIKNQKNNYNSIKKKLKM